MAGAADPGLAQMGQSLKSGDGPLDIEATEGIEWRRDEQLYIAHGDARVTRGEVSLYGQVITAHYRDGKSGSEIDRIDATGNVRIISPTETIYGDRGAYDLVNGILVMVGNNLRLEGENFTITARDSLEYWETKRIAVARGAAKAVREDTQIEAEILTAHLAPDATNELGITRVDAFKDVRITDPDGVARADQAVYHVARELAILSGSVRITREDSQLNGEYAEIDLKTGISRLLPGPAGSPATTRVRGLINPGRKPKSDDDF